MVDISCVVYFDMVVNLFYGGSTLTGQHMEGQDSCHSAKCVDEMKGLSCHDKLYTPQCQLESTYTYR